MGGCPCTDGGGVQVCFGKARKRKQMHANGSKIVGGEEGGGAPWPLCPQGCFSESTFRCWRQRSCWSCSDVVEPRARWTYCEPGRTQSSPLKHNRNTSLWRGFFQLFFSDFHLLNWCGILASEFVTGRVFDGKHVVFLWKLTWLKCAHAHAGLTRGLVPIDLPPHRNTGVTVHREQPAEPVLYVHHTQVLTHTDHLAHPYLLSIHLQNTKQERNCPSFVIFFWGGINLTTEQRLVHWWREHRSWWMQQSDGERGWAESAAGSGGDSGSQPLHPWRLKPNCRSLLRPNLWSFWRKKHTKTQYSLKSMVQSLNLPDFCFQYAVTQAVFTLVTRGLFFWRRRQNLTLNRLV